MLLLLLFITQTSITVCTVLAGICLYPFLLNITQELSEYIWDPGFDFWKCPQKWV